MTTIAYKNGVIAGDRQSTNGNRVQYNTIKVFKTTRFLYGIAGPAELIDPFMSWLAQSETLTEEKGCPPNTWLYPNPIEDECPAVLDSELECLVVSIEDRQVWHMMSNGHAVDLGFDVPAALGTGDQFALGAMEAGASAVEAVAIAIKYDAFSGGEVMMYEADADE